MACYKRVLTCHQAFENYSAVTLGNVSVTALDPDAAIYDSTYYSSSYIKSC